MDANIVTDAPSDSSFSSPPFITDATDSPSITNDTSNLQALLAFTMNSVSDNEAVRDMIWEILKSTAGM